MLAATASGKEMTLIYLDHQASTPLHPAAEAALRAAAGELVANPHSNDHAAGWGAADAIDAARRDIAAAIAADPDEIVFTSGATEANNIAMLGLGTPTNDRNRIVVSAIEHKAVLGPARELARRGFELVIAPVTTAGVIDVAATGKLIDERTALVACMMVNNEIGTVQPVADIAAQCARAGARLHIDAAQALAWMPIDVAAIGAETMSLSGHKMGGPKGIGALFVRRDVHDDLHPLYFGGEQEGGLRPGTLPTPLCASFGAACRNLPTTAEVAAWRDRTALLERAIMRAFPGAVVNGRDAPRHPGALSVTLAGVDGEQLIMRLQPELAISRGSACTSGIPEPSHVLRAIGLGAAACDSTIRIGVGRSTVDQELETASALLVAAVVGLDGALHDAV